MAYPKKPKKRHALPNRRLAENIKVTTADGHTVHLTVGYDPHEIDRPREVFYAGGFRSGSALEFQIQDTCVMISLLLQHGHMPADIAKSLAREEQPDGELQYASVTGLIVEELAMDKPQG